MATPDSPSAGTGAVGDAAATDPCAQADAGALRPAEALERIRARLPRIVDRERLPLREALDRVLATELRSPMDVPPHDNAAMDGCAVRGGDLPATGARELRLIGAAWAGRPFEGRVERGQAARIATGALLPAGADTVLRQEDVAALDGERIRIGAGHRRGENVRRAGEDMARGQAILPVGRRLTPADLGLLASLGQGVVEVRRRLRVAFFSTGDELRSIGEPLRAGEIYDSNRYTLHGMILRGGAIPIDLGVAPDDPAALRAAVREAAAQADVIVTSGGVSVGAADYVREVLRQEGAVDFWQIAMRPGRPLAFGVVRDRPFFGLPGNPVAVMVDFYLFALPALRAMAGEIEDDALTRVVAVAETALRKRPGRAEFQRGVMTRRADGKWSVRPTGFQGAGVLRSMSAANCLIALPEERGAVAAGEPVTVQPFVGLI